ncbi:IS66 family transposase [Paraburkholderia sp. IW21]|uniref:IS66 family transposase n=1 Tax=Paraburkholderia sp. IW21 TaxID=3242488 RepID=UPI00351F9167
MPINVTIDADELRALLAIREEHDALQSERDGLRSALRLVTAERDLAEERLRAYRRELFGAKSEARASDQPGLFNEAEVLGTNATPAQEDTRETTIAAHTRKKRGHRKPLDPSLPREVVRHELPEAERFCNHDEHALVEIGVETSEQLDVIPEQVRVIQHQRVKYACPCCDLGIKVTPAPARIIPRGLLTESALAWVATGKYQFGMPIYRQAGLLRRFGGDISSNTLAASMVRVGLATQPVINLMRDALLDADVIYCDETTFQVLKEEGRKPQTKSYLWAQMTGSGTPIRCFAYTAGRGAKLADKLFAGIRKGAVLTDGYEPYNGIAQQYQLVHLGCWAHARRYLVKPRKAPRRKAVTPTRCTTRWSMRLVTAQVRRVRTRRAGCCSPGLVRRRCRTAVARCCLVRTVGLSIRLQRPTAVRPCCMVRAWDWRLRHRPERRCLASRSWRSSTLRCRAWWWQGQAPQPTKTWVVRGANS